MESEKVLDRYNMRKDTLFLIFFLVIIGIVILRLHILWEGHDCRVCDEDYSAEQTYDDLDYYQDKPYIYPVEHTHTTMRYALQRGENPTEPPRREFLDNTYVDRPMYGNSDRWTNKN